MIDLLSRKWHKTYDEEIPIACNLGLNCTRMRLPTNFYFSIEEFDDHRNRIKNYQEFKWLTDLDATLLGCSLEWRIIKITRIILVIEIEISSREMFIRYSQFSVLHDLKSTAIRPTQATFTLHRHVFFPPLKISAFAKWKVTGWICCIFFNTV